MGLCEKRKKGENGAIVIEATISLTAFIFAIYTILSIVNICYIQSRINVALNAAAKDIAQYSYLYYAFGMDDLQAGWYEDTKDESALARQTVDNVAGLVGILDSANDAKASIQDGTASTDQFKSLYADIETCGGNVKSLVGEYRKQIGDDPKQFIFGMAKMAGNELAEEGKVLLAELMGQILMEKNLVANESDSADAYLRRYNVKDGVDGLDFNYSTLMAYGTTNKIQLCVTYEVEVVKILNIDFSFKIRQVTQTNAWGNGISVIEANNPTPEVDEEKGESAWDLGDSERGHYIIENEKAKYPYATISDDKRCFHAYDDSKNQFINIVTTNTHDKSYNTELTSESKVKGNIKNKISASYNKMTNAVGKLDTDIVIKNQNDGGKETTVKSDKDTRKYKVVVVVPEDADATFLAGIKEEMLKSGSYPNLEIEFLKGYGVPSEKEAPSTETQQPAA